MEEYIVQQDYVEDGCCGMASCKYIFDNIDCAIAYVMLNVQNDINHGFVIDNETLNVDLKPNEYGIGGTMRVFYEEQENWLTYCEYVILKAKHISSVNELIKEM